MGLDQYAFYARKGIKTNDRESLEEEHAKNEFMYWRKEYCIDNWMHRLYRARGGKEEFNCEFVKVTEADLDALEEAANDINFYCNGYYRNANMDMEHDKPHIDKFIKLAREHIANGQDVYYSNWW